MFLPADRPPIVGITGGMGCGKSSVSRFMSQRGFSLVDADSLAKEAVRPGCVALRKIAEVFGSGILLRDGGLNRAALAEIVFSDPDELQTLNGILQPEIRNLFLSRIRRESGRAARVPVVFDAPLLMEENYLLFVDRIIVVYAGKGAVAERLGKGRDLKPEQIEARMKFQLDPEEKMRRADYLIENNGSIEALLAKTDCCIGKICLDLDISLPPL